MNERIKELAEQAAQAANEATNAFNDDTGAWRMVWDEVYDQKFAELIVKECARVGGDIVLYQNEDNDMGVFLGIKQHFGVKE